MAVVVLIFIWMPLSILFDSQSYLGTYIDSQSMVGHSLVIAL